MDSAIVISYSRALPGREREAFEAFQDAFTFFGKLAAEGLCMEPEVFLGPFGKGMFLVKGERDHLIGIMDGEDFRRLYLKTSYVVPDIGYELFYFGDSVTEWMGLWASVGEELGYM